MTKRIVNRVAVKPNAPITIKKRTCFVRPPKFIYGTKAKKQSFENEFLKPYPLIVIRQK